MYAICPTLQSTLHHCPHESPSCRVGIIGIVTSNNPPVWTSFAQQINSMKNEVNLSSHIG
ncbi:hypothetical protein P168DRAFT_148723 [Aspergillus campestris IBT 28561]|uniref:Uncharacterized protein n=1 Tax=Aspergillus campestris (strain IBT 28561) TaxID=1392248 RepID=A0A2I1D607_ASPC2|nr:uncharacterized protein P168DRAFT_148723 [Aspergillus campestris IBT 28561]PKY05299.1 hypothetical protein P168DRAFT_148723 [Aspergillus campestris IBT 28561]